VEFDYYGIKLPSISVRVVLRNVLGITLLIIQEWPEQKRRYLSFKNENYSLVRKEKRNGKVKIFESLLERIVVSLPNPSSK